MPNYLIKRWFLSLTVLGFIFSTSMCHVLLEKCYTKKQEQIKQSDKVKNNDDSKKEELTRGVKGAPFGLIFTSDIHVGSPEGSNKKPNQIAQIINDLGNSENNIRAVCMAGDLTDIGSDEQFSQFLTTCIHPMAWLMPDEPHHGIYLCKGNHDENTGKAPKLLKFLKEEYGDYRYSFDIEDLHIVCCGKYPDLSLFPNLKKCCDMPNTIKWLEADLADVGTKRPIVLFWHLNIMGNMSDWWGVNLGKWKIQKPITVKNALYDLLKNYNVKYIFFGHLHCTFCTKWRGTIPVADVAGKEYALCTYDPATQEFNVKFKDGMGKEYTEIQREDNGKIEL